MLTWVLALSECINRRKWVRYLEADILDPGWKDKASYNYGKENRSPKGNMWSAIPIALLCMIVKWREMKQGSGPERDKVL